MARAKARRPGSLLALADEDLDVVHATRTARIMPSSSGGIVLLDLPQEEAHYLQPHPPLPRVCVRARRARDGGSHRSLTGGMTDDHPNAVAYRLTADAFRARDMEALATLLTDDVIWHVPGEHSMAGDIRGREKLLEWLTAVSGIGFWLQEHAVFGDDEHVCALSVMGAKREGVDVETRVVSIFHFREGRQSERWFYPEDDVAWNEIFSPEATSSTP